MLKIVFAVFIILRTSLRAVLSLLTANGIKKVSPLKEWTRAACVDFNAALIDFYKRLTFTFKTCKLAARALESRNN